MVDIAGATSVARYRRLRETGGDPDGCGGPFSRVLWVTGHRETRLQNMSPETLSSINVGVAVISVLIVFFRWMGQDLLDLRSEICHQTRTCVGR